MGNLSRRGLFGVAGLLATAPLLPPPVEAEAFGPPNGARFCMNCVPKAWDEKWKLFERVAPSLEVRKTLRNGDVYLNSKGTQLLYVMQLREGNPGWVAELDFFPDNEDFPSDEPWLQRPRCGSCGSDARSYPMKVTYGHVMVDWRN